MSVEQADMHVSHHGCEMAADLPRARSMRQWGSNLAANLRNSRLVLFIAAMLTVLAAANLIWLPFSTVDPNPHLSDIWDVLPSALLMGFLELIRWRLGKVPFRNREVGRDF